MIDFIGGPLLLLPFLKLLWDLQKGETLPLAPTTGELELVELSRMKFVTGKQHRILESLVGEELLRGRSRWHKEVFRSKLTQAEQIKCRANVDDEAIRQDCCAEDLAVVPRRYLDPPEGR